MNDEDNSILVSVSHVNPESPLWLQLKVSVGSTVKDAILSSGILHRYPDMNIEKMNIGIFGKVTTLDQGLIEGDRVEIYHSIIVDPKTVPRRKKIRNKE